MSERVLRIGIKGMKHSGLLQDFNNLTFMRKFSSLIVSNITEPAKCISYTTQFLDFLGNPLPKSRDETMVIIFEDIQ